WINYGSLKQTQGDLAAAIKLFQQAIDTDPSLALAHYNLGLAHRTRGYLGEAIAAYQRAIELQPDYPEAHQNLGVALFKLGKLPESLAAFSQAVKIYQRTDPAYAVSLKQRLKSLGLPDAMLAQARLV
ncbi:MAG: tetratricopeptide repeat protein, partial [Leptolyngbyaceae cyanobacterium SM2_3_12]|nr:tetratricopeptide repeat protein [Leptolyngbyaceae cyanobacterium SM2_3_12]